MTNTVRKTRGMRKSKRAKQEMVREQITRTANLRCRGETKQEGGDQRTYTCKTCPASRVMASQQSILISKMSLQGTTQGKEAIKGTNIEEA